MDVTVLITGGWGGSLSYPSPQKLDGQMVEAYGESF